MSDAKLVALGKRINAVMDEIDEKREFLRDIYTEAKGNGYIPKMLRKAISRQRMDGSKREEEDSILDLYDHALGNLGKALRAISEGATWQEAGKENGVPRATLARAAAVSKQREVIPEQEAAVAEQGPPSNGGTPNLAPAKEPESAVAGSGPGAQPGTSESNLPNGIDEAVDRAFFKSVEIVEPAEQPPPPIQIGAVASHSDGERVASFKPDPGEPFDDLAIPVFLRRSFRADAEARSPVASGSAE